MILLKRQGRLILSLLFVLGLLTQVAWIATAQSERSPGCQATSGKNGTYTRGSISTRTYFEGEKIIVEALEAATPGAVTSSMWSNFSRHTIGGIPNRMTFNIPRDGEYSLSWQTEDGEQVRWAVSCTRNSEGDGPQPFAYDGRINAFDSAAPIAVYVQNGELVVWYVDYNTSQGIQVLTVTAEQVAAVAEYETVAVSDVGGVVVARLEGTRIQVWAGMYNGNIYVLRFDMASPIGHESEEIKP